MTASIAGRYHIYKKKVVWVVSMAEPAFCRWQETAPIYALRQRGFRAKGSFLAISAKKRTIHAFAKSIPFVHVLSMSHDPAQAPSDVDIMQKPGITIAQLALAINALLIAGFAFEAEARNKKFSCPLPDKRSCMSTVDVYNETNSIVLPEPVMEPDKRKPTRQLPAAPVQIEPVAGQPVAVPPRCCEPTQTEVTVKGDTLAVASPVVAVVNPAVSTNTSDLVVRTSRKEPFREPARVMRIYIAPWEDESGDLHMGNYVFSEIVPRKWSVGTRQSDAMEGYRLLSFSPTNSPTRDAVHDAQSSKGSATTQAGRTD